MNKEYLLNVAKALRESPYAAMFSMTDYANPACGTPMCALGHYAARQDLQSLLVLDNKRRASRYDSPVFYADSGKAVTYDSARLCEHFGISSDDADELFGPDGCDNAATPIEAANYIEHFVAEHE
jgi:hypothetical protein